MPTMDIKDIKVGETYNVRVRVEEKYDNKIITNTIDSKGISCFEASSIFSEDELPAFSPVRSSKYDPCRRFRKGDKVRVVKMNGRTSAAESIIPDLAGMILEVTSNEDSDGDVFVDTPRGGRFIAFYFLELISPVEKQVSFRVGDFAVDGEWFVWKNSFGKTEIISSYKIDTHPNAKAAAEAECARLNTELRKERK